MATREHKFDFLCAVMCCDSFARIFGTAKSLHEVRAMKFSVHWPGERVGCLGHPTPLAHRVWLGKCAVVGDFNSSPRLALA